MFTFKKKVEEKLNNYFKGFTILELLVVIAVIGILSAVILAVTSNQRAKARDAQRMSDIRQMRTAIELYISQNGTAPTFSGNCVAGSADTSCFANDADIPAPRPHTWASLATQLSPYMRALPKDPCNVRCYDASDGSDGVGRKFFVYRYDAPGLQVNVTGNVGTNNQYRIYAQNLETKNQAYGHNGFIGISSSGTVGIKRWAGGI